MPQISLDDLKAWLEAEKADALSAVNASKLSEERSLAMDYYMGDMSKDMEAPPDRSRAVSTDVLDTVEGLMPALMEIFCSGDEVVAFNPVGPEDEEAAQQETDYVNHEFMEKNTGFITLYSMIKDALLQKVGIVKSWWERKEVEDEEYYEGLTDDAFAMLRNDPEVEIVKQVSYPMGSEPPEEGEEDDADGSGQLLPNPA
jgi:hypothetical protein